MIGRAVSQFSDLENNPVYQYGLLVFITLLGLLLRFYKLGEWSFWIDEVFSIGRIQAHYSTLNVLIKNIPPNLSWIPLSLILTSGVFNLLGISEWSARLIPAMIGSISIPLLYFPIKKMSGPGIGLISVVLLAISPWHIFWSQNARYATSLMLFYALAMFFTFFSLEWKRFRYLLFAWSFLYLAMGERLTSLFYFPVLLVYLLAILIFNFNRLQGFRWLYFGGILILPAIIFGLYDIYHYFIDRSSVLYGLFVTFIGQPNHSPVRLLLSIIYRIGVPVFLMGIFGAVYLAIRNRRLGLFIAAAAIVPIFLLVTISPFVFTVDRYIFVTLPFWMILSAAAIQGLLSSTEGSGQWLALGVFVLLLLHSLSENYLYYQYQNGGRPDWKSAYQLIQQNAQVGDLILSTRPEVGEYYFSGDVGYINSFDVESVEWEGKRIWFLIDKATGWVEPGLHEWILKNSELIEVVQAYLPGRDMAIRIYLRDPNH